MLPTVTDGIVITVRKFRPNSFRLEELVANGTLSPSSCDELRAAVEHCHNILISRATGSGKTTLVKALLDLIPEHERVLLIEDAAELPLERPNGVRFIAREGVSIRDLLGTRCSSALSASGDEIAFGRFFGEVSIEGHMISR
jgi:Flp pilus assembly CpaF family ATPase